MVRNSYLVNRVFKKYILINILISLAISIGFIVDGMIVGNLLGEEALAAVNLSSPIIQLIVTVGTLINGGGSILASIEIGKGNIEKVKKLFTTAMFLNLLFGAAICLSGVMYIDEIVNILCSTESLRPLVKSYVSVVIYTSPIYLLTPGLCSFLRIDSSPTIVFISLVVANAINLILDYSFIKFFGFGIASSSIASAIGLGIAFIIAALFHFTKKEKLLSISTLIPIKKWHESLSIGFPLAIGSLLSSFVILFVNHTIASELGIIGLTILPLCFSMMMFSGLFIGGVIQTLHPLGGVLFGENDYQGMMFAIKTSLIFLLTSLFTLTFLIELFPFQFASLFGVNDYDQYLTISNAVRIFALAIPFSGVVAVLSFLYIIVGEKKKALIITIINGLIIIPVIYIFKNLGEGYIWGSFVFSQIITLLSILYFKIPSISPNKDIYYKLDVSFKNTEQHRIEFNEKLMNFFTSIQFLEVFKQRILEIHTDITENIKTSIQWKNIDVIIKVNNKTVIFSSKDDAPYDKKCSWILGQNNRLITYEII